MYTGSSITVDGTLESCLKTIAPLNSINGLRSSFSLLVLMATVHLIGELSHNRFHKSYLVTTAMYYLMTAMTAYLEELYMKNSALI